MIFSEQYQKVIFEAVQKNRWDIYNAESPNFKVAGTLIKFLIKTPKLELRNKYILLPGRKHFNNYDNLDSKVLDQKVLDLAEKVKPTVMFYLEKEELKRLVLDGIMVKIELSKSNEQFVSYMQFVGMLETLKKHDIDKFV